MKIAYNTENISSQKKSIDLTPTYEEITKINMVDFDLDDEINSPSKSSTHERKHKR